MFKLNNRGQSLVLFIVFVPILLVILTLVYDVGTAIWEKNKLSNVSYLVVDYGLDNIKNIDENELVNFVMKNTNNLSNISINIDNSVINIKLTKKIKGVIGKMFGFNLITASCEYKGYILDNNKKIEKVR